MLTSSISVGVSLLLCAALICICKSRKSVSGKLSAREEQLALAQQEIRQRVRELDEFRGKYLHDLRSPLQTVTGYADLLIAERTGPLNTKQKRFLENLRDGAQKLLEIIDGKQTEQQPGELERQQREPKIVVGQM